ncbi:hypothetical protein L3Q82_013017, partial [Scortum barcoo]
HTVKRVMWFRVSADGRREFAHHTDPNQISLSYRGRTRYIGGSYSSCSVQIRVVKLSDAGQYHFRFETDQPLGRWTSPTTITLDVTDLQVQVHPARPANMFGFGETVFVGCQARGCAAPGRSLALYRNGLNLGSYEKWMIINRFDQQHAGAYTCRPIPPQNVQSPSLSLALGYGPHSTSITVFPAGEVSEGGSVTLTCNSDAAPPVESFAWFKDMESGSIPDSFRPQLHLSLLKHTDRGEYFCVARNSLGTDRSKPLLLNVTYSPKNTRVLVSPPGDIREGSNVNLSCVSQAFPPPSRYAWYRILGDQVLAKGTVQNLTFSVVRAHHAGQYYCTAWSRLGYQTSPVATLTVLYPPKNTSVLARPSSVVDAGRPLTLTCSSQANPAVDNFTWHRLALDGGSVQSWGTKSGPVFTFSEVGPGESGQYYCEARNRIGAHSSPVLTVRVRGRLKVIALASAVGVSAGLITLTVAIMISKNMHRVDMESGDAGNKEEPEDLSDSSHPAIVPLKDAPPVTESHSPATNYITVHYSKLSSFQSWILIMESLILIILVIIPDHFKYVGDYDHDCSLQINNVQPADEGEYYFRFVTTFNGWTSKTSAQLSVRELTTVIKPSTVTEGGNVTLTCNTGCPTPTYVMWLKDGQHVLNPVFQARREDAGRYSCAILGQERARSAPVALNVQYAPREVTLSVSPLDVVEGGSVTFTCSSDANPSVTPSGHGLFKDGHFISSGKNFTISDVQLNHSGLYHCQASNNISRRGNDLINSTEVHLGVQYRPMNVSISMDPPDVVKGNAVNLTCNSLANPAADNYTWYKMAASASQPHAPGGIRTGAVYFLYGGVPGWALHLPGQEPMGGEQLDADAAALQGKAGWQPVPPDLSWNWSLSFCDAFGGDSYFVLVSQRGNRGTSAERKKQPAEFDFRLRGKDLSSSAAEDESNSIYVNIHTMPTSPPPVANVADRSYRNSQHEHDDHTSNGEDVTYSTVTIKPKNPNDSRDMQDSW